MDIDLEKIIKDSDSSIEKIPLKDLSYWSVELQEAYFSPKEVKKRIEQINKK